MTTSLETQTPYLHVVESNGAQPDEIHKHLDVAVDKAIAHAIKIGSHGVLVTQHSYHLYSVTLDEDVPYGQIKERVIWRHAKAVEASDPHFAFLLGELERT